MTRCAIRSTRRLTGGRGVDIILDPLGGAVFDAALRALAWCGRLVVIGFAAGGIPTLKTNYLLLKNIEVIGLQVSDYRKRRPEQMAACYAEVFALYEQRRLQPGAAITFPLEQAGEALAALRDRRLDARAVLHVRGACTGEALQAERHGSYRQFQSHLPVIRGGQGCTLSV